MAMNIDLEMPGLQYSKNCMQIVIRYTRGAQYLGKQVTECKLIFTTIYVLYIYAPLDILKMNSHSQEDLENMDILQTSIIICKVCKPWTVIS